MTTSGLCLEDTICCHLALAESDVINVTNIILFDQFEGWMAEATEELELLFKLSLDYVTIQQLSLCLYQHTGDHNLKP